MKVFSSRSVQLVYSTDRRRVFVDLRIHIPEKLLQLNNEIRTVKATNNYDNLKFYLYFSEPILNSSAEILNSLNTSEGVLLPISGENLMNRKFGFQVNLCPRLICLSRCSYLCLCTVFCSCVLMLTAFVLSSFRLQIYPALQSLQ